MGPKYEFTDKTLNHEGHLLHKIRRLSDGKIGGWIESEDNLSQEGNCWVDGEAKVYSEAKVYGNAKVYDDVWVYDNARVYDNAQVYNDAKIGHSAQIYGNAKVYGYALVCGNAKVYNQAEVYDEAQVYDEADVYSYARVHGNAHVWWKAEVYGKAEVFDDAKVYEYAEIYGSAKIYGDARVCGCDAKIDSGEYTHGLFFSKGNPVTFSKSNNNETKKVVQDFIYKVDDSSKLTTQTEYNSVDEFFSESVKNDIKLDTLVICTVDTKEPLIKLQKVEVEDKTEFKFIVDITNEDNDDFRFRSIIKSQKQLDQLVLQTIEALKQYPKFRKYADDLEEYL